MFLSAKYPEFFCCCIQSLTVIQRDPSVCWLFTSTFPMPLNDGTSWIIQPTHCSIWLATNKSSAWV